MFRVGIVLSQDTQSIELDHLDASVLASLSDTLRSDMALVVSNFDIGTTTIDVTDGQCPKNSVCGMHTTTFSNFQWTSYDAIEEDKLMIGDVADKIDRCDDPLCTACHETFWLSEPSEIAYQCTDYTRYKYSNQCNNWKNKDNLCGPEDLCFRSWAADDPKKWKSEEAACRPLP